LLRSQDRQKKAARKRLIVVGWMRSGILGAELDHFLCGQVILKSGLRYALKIDQHEFAKIANWINMAGLPCYQFNLMSSTPGACINGRLMQ
jgi:hypothetical protein